MRRSHWLRNLMILLLLLALPPAAVYVYFTRPGVLRSQVEAAFARAGLRVTRLDEISFTPWGGLEVENLALDPAEPSHWNPLIERPALVQVERARVYPSLPDLLLGRVTLNAVSLDHPAISWVLHQAPDAASTPSARATEVDLGALLTGLPSLRIERGDVNLWVLEPGGLRLLRRWAVSGRGDWSAVPEPGATRGYFLRIRQTGGPVPRRPDSPDEPLLELHADGHMLRGRIGWVETAVVRELLPAAWRERVASAGLSAVARLADFAYWDGQVRGATLEFEQLESAIPVEEPGRTAPAIASFLQLRSAAGSIQFRERPDAGGVPTQTLQLALDGQLNDGRLSLALQAAGNALHAESDAPSLDRWLGALGSLDATLRVDSITLPNVDAQPAFVQSERLPDGVRSFFRNFDPRGMVNLAARVARRSPPAASGEGDADADPWTYDGRVEALGGTTFPRYFPYLWRDVRGTVRFSDAGITLEALSGSHGSATMRINGRVNNVERWTGFQLSVDAKDVALDRDLLAALPEEYAGVWRDADPVGLCDVAVELTRAEGSERTGPLPTGIQVDALLTQGGLTAGRTVRLEDASGHFRIEDGMLQISRLAGTHRGATVQLSGALDLRRREAGRAERVSLNTSDLPLERVSHVRDAQGESLGEIRFAGRGNVWGSVSRGADGLRDDYSVEVTDGTLTAFAADLPWSRARGWITLDDREQRIVRLDARRGEDWISVNGRLPAEGRTGQAALEVRSETGAMDQLLRQLIPARWARLREMLGASGAGGLEMSLRVDPDAESALRQQAEIQLTLERLRPLPLPLDLRRIDARLSLNAHGFELKNAAAHYGANGRVEVAGSGRWEGAAPWSELHVDLHEIAIDAAFVEAMPEPLARLLRRMAVQGRADGTIDRLRVSGGAGSEWDFIGRLSLIGTDLRVGLPLENADGELSGRCLVPPNQEPSLELDFLVSRGVLAGRPIERWEGHVIGEPGARWLRIEELRGRIADGEVFGFARFDPVSGAHELSLTLSGLRLGDLIRPGKPGGSVMREGRVDGHVFVRAESDDPASRVGGGELSIRGASLLASPVTASVVEATRGRRGSLRESVEQALVKFAWVGDDVNLSYVDIQSSDLRLVGEGHWNTDTNRLSMTLLGAPPATAPQLGVLSELIESAGRELMQFRIDGTADAPRVTVEPFHGLTEPLRRMMRGGR